MSAYLTTAEVAAELRCSGRKVRETATAAGVGVQLAGKAGWRFSPADVDAIVAYLTPTPPIPARRRRRRAA